MTTSPSKGSQSALLGNALALAARGWAVFPTDGKRPRTPRGFHDAAVTAEFIKRWWKTWPEAGIGIPTGASSGLVVLDVDPGNGGNEALRALVRENEPLPATVECVTGGLGRHLYFRHPGRPVRNSAGKLGPGLDIRGDGGYVVAPPSLHESGRSYHWLVGCSPDDRDPAELPGWLAEQVLRQAPSRNGSAQNEPIPEGQRNSYLTSLAGSWRRHGMDVDEITAALKVCNEKQCSPPLDDREVEAIAASIGRYGPGSPVADKVRTNDKGSLRLPPTPELHDVAGHCAWLTAVFNLDRAHPITGGRREGVLGPEGHAVLYRAGAPPIRFEPVGRISSPLKLIEALGWRETSSDGVVPAFKSEHCRLIAHVIRMLCGVSEGLTDQQEAAGIVGTFTQAALPIEERTTYGTSAQRYEAALALRRATDDITGRPMGPARYLIDSNTGELVIAVGDLAEAARRHTGSSLPRGWLDGRMSALDWARITLDGHALPGRGGRKGPHARVDAYRGVIAPTDDR